MTFQDIRYGWLAIAGISVIGTTIYVTNNERRQVNQVDIIEIALGTYERCLTTERKYYEGVLPREGSLSQYLITPPSFVRIIKDESGDSVTVTNTIGWHIDRSMMIELDSTITSLVPYFTDSDNPTNTLTVTGLWDKLNIGDGTNQFTRTPAIGTNIATYGDYPWQIYASDLEERYKVLNALKDIPIEELTTGNTMAPSSYGSAITYSRRALTPNYPRVYPWLLISPETSWADGMIQATDWWEITNFWPRTQGVETSITATVDNKIDWSIKGDGYHEPHMYARKAAYEPFVDYSNFDTNIYTNGFFLIYSFKARSVSPFGYEWSDQGAIGAEDEWITFVDEYRYVTEPTIYSFNSFSLGSTNQPLFSTAAWSTRGNGTEYDYDISWQEKLTNSFDLLTNGFYYCTNKYW